MLDGRQLGDRIVNALANLSDEEIKDHRTVWRTIASIIVDYFKDNAEVYGIQTQVPGVQLGQGTAYGTQTVNGRIK